MRIAFLSDIHGNREALDACLAHAGRQTIDRFVFLGDLVGYGADPVYIVDKVNEFKDRGALVILGNHDLAAATGDTSNMNEYAKAALDWTFRELDADARAFLKNLPMSEADEDRLYVHADAFSPTAWNYVTDASRAERSMRATTKRLTLCGHVHRPALYHMMPTKPAVHFLPQTGAGIPVVGNRQWLAVMGAVGQPRDENPAAAYGVFDTATQELTYLRVPYDIESAVEKIHAAKLPRILAARLFVGR